MGETTYVLSESGREHHWEGVGSLSIKTFFGGRAKYAVGPGRYAVDDGSYLVLNDGTEYTIEVDAARPLESFCIFFERGFAEEVQRSRSLRADALLDEPEASRAEPVRFFQRVFPHDKILSPALFRLRRAMAAGKTDAGWVREQLHVIIRRLLRVHYGELRRTGDLDAARPATREELYRRLHRARDYAAACFDQPVLLDDLARVACLSPNHLLRTFRQAFGVSPHQYLTSLRLDEARSLLAANGCTVTDTCFAVGFESLGSFSALFHRRFGVSPDKFRRQKR